MTQQPLDRPAFPWLNSQEGISDEVLPPWTPVVVTPGGQRAPLGSVSLACWGRTHEFANGPFPDTVVTAGRSILAEPVRLRARTDGQELRWACEGFRVVEESPARAAFVTRLAGGPLTVAAQTALEYDGMIRVDWELRPTRAAALEELTLEIPLVAEHARYLYHYPGRWGESYNARALPPEGILAEFRPFIWLGDEERGLAWFCESDEHWHPHDAQRAIEIVREGDQVILRLRLVSKPIALAPAGAESAGAPAALSYTFGFHATPVRPNPEDVWDWRLCHGADYGIERLDPEAPATVRYPAEGNIQLDQGTVELWVQPLFDVASAEREHVLFELQLPRGDSIRWSWLAGGQGMRLLIRQQQDRIVELYTRPEWKPGQFHHVAFTWGDAVRVYHDGELIAEAPRRGTFVGSLTGGALVFGGESGHLLVDDIRISAVARTAEELCRAAAGEAPAELDDRTLLLDRLDQAFEPGAIEHLDGGYGGYASTRPERAAGDWGWNRKPGGIVGLGRFRAGKFGNALELGLDKPLLDYFAELGVRTLCFHEQWADLEAYPATPHEAKLRSLVKACHERGMLLLLYHGFLLSDLAPEWPAMGAECAVEPRHAYDPYDYPPQPHQVATTVCYNSIWQDRLADGIAKLMDEFDVDGVYLDGTANPWPCSNALHGCGYERPDGTRAPTYPIFATRQMMRRIYTIVKTRKPHGQINVHQSTCMTIPTLSWATGYWDGEQFGSIESQFALETIPLDAFRTEFMGHQWGVPAEFLCYDRPYTYEQACAFTLLHDVLVRANGLGPHLELESRLWQLSDEFGRKEAQWLPYWRNGEYVTVEPQTALASLYLHPSNGVLGVISNLGRERAEVKVALSLDRIGLSDSARARDALSGEEVPLKEGTLALALGSLEWRIVWVREG